MALENVRIVSTVVCFIVRIQTRKRSLLQHPSSYEQSHELSVRRSAGAIPHRDRRPRECRFRRSGRTNNPDGWRNSGTISLNPVRTSSSENPGWQFEFCNRGNHRASSWGSAFRVSQIRDLPSRASIKSKAVTRSSLSLSPSSSLTLSRKPAALSRQPNFRAKPFHILF